MTAKKNMVGTKNIAVILNGCGHRDGSEIHEAVLTLLAIEQAGASWEALALDKNQASVLNHLDGSVDKNCSPRNMLNESARIARGRIKNLQDVTAKNYDAVIIPGGSGTASNLCDFAVSGKHMSVNPTVRDFLMETHSLRKPIGAICIAPVLLANVFGKMGVTLTLGDARGGAALAAEGMGAAVRDCRADQCVVDEVARVVTTPAYMLDATLRNVSIGISSLVYEIIRLTDEADKKS
jgi:enhancing lycopene biosynthesis protein 2